MSTINTNIPSLIAARVLGSNNQLLSRTLERLSTGYRINRGEDDPAGLIASETLRSEKTAISAAIDNAERANNVVGVAEGALTEVSSLMLQLEDLVDRSASEAGMSDSEVEANQLQIDSILESINRIAVTTTFAGKKLLDGQLEYTTSGVNSTNLQNVSLNSVRMADGSTRTVRVDVTASAQKAQLTHAITGSSIGSTATVNLAGNQGVETLTFVNGTNWSAIAATVNELTDETGVTATLSAGANALYFSSSDYGSSQFVSVEALSGTFAVTGGTSATRDTGVDATVSVNGVQGTADGLNVSARAAGLDVDLILGENFANGTTATESAITTFTVTGGGAKFNISPDLSLAGQVAIGLNAVTTSKLGDSVTGRLSSLGSGQTNQLSSKNFQSAQEIVRLASDQVASMRGRLGQLQANTLGTMVNSLQIALENVSSAESAIRDADFAEEASNLTRAQILVQTSTSALQLANQVPQNVLALLG